jgi:hypothetical protein
MQTWVITKGELPSAISDSGFPNMCTSLSLQHGYSSRGQECEGKSDAATGRFVTGGSVVWGRQPDFVPCQSARVEYKLAEVDACKPPDLRLGCGRYSIGSVP